MQYIFFFRKTTTAQIRYHKNKIAFKMKCCRKIMRIPWIAHCTNCSILNELHLPTNWLYNFIRRQKIWPRYSTQWFKGDNNSRNVHREKKQRKAKRDMGEIHHMYVRYDGSKQAEWRMTGVNFSETSGQRRPGEDMFREDNIRRSPLSIGVVTHVQFPSL